MEVCFRGHTVLLFTEKILLILYTVCGFGTSRLNILFWIYFIWLFGRPFICLYAIIKFLDSPSKPKLPVGMVTDVVKAGKK